MATQKTKFLLPASKATFYGIAEDRIYYQLPRLHSMASQKTKFVTSFLSYILWHRRKQNLLPDYKATLYGNAEEKSSLYYVLCVFVSSRLFIIHLFCTTLFSLYSVPQIRL